MKRLFCCVLVCMPLMGATAFAQCGFETDVKEIAVETAQGNIMLSVEGGNFKVGARCLPEREINVKLREKSYILKCEAVNISGLIWEAGKKKG